MFKINKKRFTKAICYRLSAMLFTQAISWILTQNIMINAVVLATDIASTVWYYVFETIYEKVKKNG